MNVTKVAPYEVRVEVVNHALWGRMYKKENYLGVEVFEGSIEITRDHSWLILEADKAVKYAKNKTATHCICNGDQVIGLAVIELFAVPNVDTYSGVCRIKVDGEEEWLFNVLKWVSGSGTRYYKLCPAMTEEMAAEYAVKRAKKMRVINAF